MFLVNPHTGKLVDVPDEGVVSQLLRAGFKEQEPEVVETVETVAAPAPRRRGRTPKSS